MKKAIQSYLCSILNMSTEEKMPDPRDDINPLLYTMISSITPSLAIQINADNQHSAYSYWAWAEYKMGEDYTISFGNVSFRVNHRGYDKKGMSVFINKTLVVNYPYNNIYTNPVWYDDTIENRIAIENAITEYIHRYDKHDLYQENITTFTSSLFTDTELLKKLLT